MEQKRLSNEIIEPDENEIDNSLLLSQLLLSTVGPKEEDKEEQKLLKLPKDEYLCPKCLIPHEIRHINEETKEVEIHCANNCQTKYLIKEYLEHMCRVSYYYYKCEICKIKMQKNYKIEEGNIFKYCFECNKIICLQCYDFIHQKLKHKNIVKSNEIFNKCSIHPNEDFIQFCINCSTHLCNKCTLSPHKGHIIVTLNSILPTQKEIDKFKHKKEEYMNKKKELLKQIEDLDNLIYLNEIVLQTYLKHQKNYYYIINVLNLYNNNINNNIMNNNINKDEEDDDERIINRCNTTINKKNKTHYMKRRVTFNSDYDTYSNDMNLNNIKNINNSSYNKNEKRKVNNISNKDSISASNSVKGEKKNLREILTNISKNRERGDSSAIKGDRKSRYDRYRKTDNNIWENDDFKQSNEKKSLLRYCSQDIRSNLELENGNVYLEKFNKEFGNKTFLDKRKVELWGARMGKEGLLVLLNNKHKFLELEELILGRVKLNSIDFLENIFVDRLKLLNLELNRISNLSIFQNLHLKNLEILNLSNNAITSIDLLSKISIPNLLKLYLSRNFIESIEIFSKVHFPKLKGLYLSENKISNISILSKASLINLVELFLNSNLITSIDVFKEMNFPFLKMLNISCNRIISIDAFGKFPCSKIEELNLRNNSISNIEPLSKVHLSSLKVLHLDNNKITDINCLSRSHLKSLQRIYLNNNMIISINIFKFLPFPKLETLTLGGNKINLKDRNNKKILDDLEKKKVYIGYL